MSEESGLMAEKICGECRHHTYEEIDRGYVCTNLECKNIDICRSAAKALKRIEETNQ